MTEFKTPKGTVLQIMDIKGKKYLQAAPRIVWFREEHPAWGIETEFLSLSESHAVCRATIKDENGRIIAQATSMETKQGFEAFVEKAETCAISRAASFCNFGTLMAQELEEQGRIDQREQSSKIKLADSPIAGKNKEYTIPFGKFKGFTLGDIQIEVLNEYASYILQKAHDENKEINGQVAEFIERVQAMS